MSRILVTGANGFVGAYLTKALTVMGHELVLLSSSMGKIELSSTWLNLPKTEMVIHLAAKTFVPESWKDPVTFFETNTLGTTRALEYCRKHQAKFIFISSYLYGNPDSLPIFESALINTPNPYALSKKISEDICAFYAANYGVPIIILRPFNIYGFGQPASFLIPTLINQLLNQQSFHVKDLIPKRDYLYITDLIDAIVKALPLPGFEIINIGSGSSYAVQEIIDTIQEIAGTAHPVTSEHQVRKEEIMNTVAGISKAATLLNWRPQVSLKDGLSQMIKAMQHAQTL
jgi:nucleoside-diphosphate-sugar epimerase